MCCVICCYFKQELGLNGSRLMVQVSYRSSYMGVGVSGMISFVMFDRYIYFSTMYNRRLFNIE